MEKKLWSNAEVVELGVESTKENNPQDMALGKDYCQYCGKGFWFVWDRDEHEDICEKNPKFGIMDDMTTDYPVPTFS